jgi:hypothetical protein
VEVDPASLNLSAFETYYDEKRPFFIAGASAFRFGGMRCMFCTNASGLGAFYSRRIGRPPQLAGFVDAISEYGEVADNTSILAAAKITGRTDGGYTLGVLNAVTGREHARFIRTPGTPEESQVVEPLTNYFVGRLKKEFRSGGTTFGGIVTSTARQTDDAIAAERLHSHAEAAGFDWTHTWGGREYSWIGSVLASSVAGTPAAIARTQRSSARYFQRPDRTMTGGGVFDAGYDTSATSLRGYGMFTRVGKDNGSLLWEAMANVRSPGFEVNDLAFLNRADYVWLNGKHRRAGDDAHELVPQRVRDSGRRNRVQLRRGSHPRQPAGVLRHGVSQLLAAAAHGDPRLHLVRRPAHTRRARGPARRL